ncbi:MAG TPA: hypothetical protein VMZ92_14305 [Planctomycetota bacterium]|nr:hypothetical protein [Planctomycetota bacterium]
MKALACVCCTPLVDVLRERFGPIADHAISISRRYPGRTSPTRSPVWWFDLPLAALKKGKGEHRYLVCRAAACGCCSFDVLRIPVKYLLDHLADLQTIKRDDETFVRLLLSAARVGRFTDLFGPGYVDFSNCKT